MIAAFSLIQRDPARRVRLVQPVQAVDLPCLSPYWNNGVRQYHRRGRSA